MCSVSSILKSVFCVLYLLSCVLYPVFCILYSLSCVLYPVFCILYSVFRNLCVNCISLSPHSSNQSSESGVKVSNIECLTLNYTGYKIQNTRCRDPIRYIIQNTWHRIKKTGGYRIQNSVEEYRIQNTQDMNGYEACKRTEVMEDRSLKI